MSPLKLLNLIHDLEQKWRKTHSEHVEKQLERRVDTFLGNICIPILYKWLSYTKKRHPKSHPFVSEQENDRLKKNIENVLKDSISAYTLDEKLISIERCINLQHVTNYFSVILKEIAESKNIPIIKYFDGEENYETTS